MISIRSMSRDEEAVLFASLLYGTRPVQEGPQPLQKDGRESTQNEEQEKFLIDVRNTYAPRVCERCGQIGHIDCDISLEEIYEFEDQLAEETQNYVDELLERRGDSISYDQFGPYLHGKSEANFFKTFENTIFCINCGGEDHLWSQCKFTPFMEVIREIPPNSTEQEFEDIYKKTFKYDKFQSKIWLMRLLQDE